jgi:hypothetical protein
LPVFFWDFVAGSTTLTLPVLHVRRYRNDNNARVALHICLYFVQQRWP